MLEVDVRSGDVIKPDIRLADGACALAVSPDDHCLAVASRSGLIHMRQLDEQRKDTISALQLHSAALKVRSSLAQCHNAIK